MKIVISLILVIYSALVFSTETVDSIADKVCENDIKCKSLLKNLDLSNVTQRMAIGQYHMVKTVYEKLQYDKDYRFSGFSHDQSMTIVSKLKELNDKLESEQDEKSNVELNLKRDEFFKIEGLELKKERDNLEEYFLKLSEMKNDNFRYDNINQVKDNFFKYRDLVNYIDDILYRKKIKSQDYISPDDWLLFSEINKFEKGSSVEQKKEEFRKWLDVGITKSPKNKVLLAFHTYLKSLPPIIDRFEKDMEIKIEKERVEKLAKDNLEKERKEKISSSPECLKMSEFLKYCGIKQQMVLVKDKIDYEHRISKRSGTTDQDRIRALTKILVSQEEGLATAKLKVENIKSSIIKLEDCNVVKKQNEGIKIELDQASIIKIRKVLKEKCEVDNYEPDTLYN